MTASVVVVAWFLEMHRNDQSKTPALSSKMFGWWMFEYRGESKRCSTAICVTYKIEVKQVLRAPCFKYTS
jgi:hypothetical protein